MPVITAIYENGVFRPLEPVEGVDDGSRVELEMRTEQNAWEKVKHLVGRIPKDELDRIEAAVEEAFEGIDPDDWK